MPKQNHGTTCLSGSNKSELSAHLCFAEQKICSVYYLGMLLFMNYIQNNCIML